MYVSRNSVSPGRPVQGGHKGTIPQTLLQVRSAWRYLLLFWTERLARVACGNFHLQFNVIRVGGKKNVDTLLCWVAECPSMRRLSLLDATGISASERTELGWRTTRWSRGRLSHSSQLSSLPQYTEARWFVGPGSSCAAHAALRGACSRVEKLPRCHPKPTGRSCK